MSLFGGGQSTFGQSTGSLFGQSTTSQTPSAFGASTAQKPSLFGQSTAQPAASTPQTGTGLFGGASTTPKPSLFGASTATQAQPSPSPFGGAATGTQSSAFGASTAKPSLFGGSTAFGSTTTQNQPQQPQGLGAAPASLGLSTQQPQQQNGQGPQQPAGAYFDTLFAMTKKRSEGTADDMPHLQLGLGDLRQRLKKLGGNKTATERGIDGRAHYVLAASGIDLGAAAKDLGSLHVHPGKMDRDIGAGPSEVDVETYLENLQTKTTLGMIQDGLDRSARDFDNFLEDNMAMEWETQRKRIYEHFGIKQRDGSLGDSAAPGRESQAGFGRSRRSKAQQAGTPSRAGRSVFGNTALQRSVIGTPARIGSHKPEFSDVERPSEPERHGVVSHDDRILREKQAKLAAKVRALNEARVFKRPYAILSEFADLEHKSQEPHAAHVAQAYRAVVEMVGEDPEAESSLNNATAKERQYVPLYLDDNRASPESLAMRKRILAGANRFLEHQFVAEMESLIKRHPQDANLGGRPDIVSKVKAYVRLRANRKDLVPNSSELQQVGGEYLWAVVFYLLRSGHIREAAAYVQEHLGSFRGIDRAFPTYLNGYVTSEDRRLKRQLQDRCASEYTQRARNAPDGSVDPFRMACYKIIGRCEVGNRSFEGLNSDIHDWIWLQFNLAREADKSTELATDMYDLADLQASIREIGSKHFPKTPSEDASGGSGAGGPGAGGAGAGASGGASGNFGMYFYLLALSGQFEEAVAYLYPFAYVDAVHFATALSYYGLLRPSDPLTADNELRGSDVRGRTQINFARMLGYYTRDFRAADSESAVDYLSLICLNADLPGEQGRRHAELCHEALRELVLETREFSRLIGDVRPDGHRIRGAIEVRGHILGFDGEEDFVRAVTLQAAASAEDGGRTTDAVLLYHLAGEYDAVVGIVSRALSESVATEIGEDPLVLEPVRPRAGNGSGESVEPGSSLSLAAIDDPVELARTMMAMYERDAMFYKRVSEVNKGACRVLLEMSSIKGLVEKQQWAQCLDRIRALDILPLDTNQDPSQIRAYASRFPSLPATVSANVPQLLLWTVHCCVRQRDQLLSPQHFTGNEASRRIMVDQMRGMVLDLTAYTGQLRYRFPPHLHEALARASAE